MDDLVKLKKGDNDAKKVWGGKERRKAPTFLVKDLQEDLKRVGTYTDVANGIFGPKTEKALKIFQWSCKNIDKCIKGTVVRARVKSALVAVNGELDKATRDELKIWVDNRQIVTGDLVRVSFSDLSNVEASPNFKKLSSVKVFKDELVVSKEALKLLKNLNKLAKEKSVTIKVNQAFREHGLKVNGAVVTPASKSQHLIGHALDCNIVDGSSWNNSTNFKNKKETANAKAIIKAVKTEGYRWGGDFSNVDTPHFDSKIDSVSFAYDSKFFLNQRMVSEGQDIPKANL